MSRVSTYFFLCSLTVQEPKDGQVMAATNSKKHSHKRENGALTVWRYLLVGRSHEAGSGADRGKIRLVATA